MLRTFRNWLLDLLVSMTSPLIKGMSISPICLNVVPFITNAHLKEVQISVLFNRTYFLESVLRAAL